MWFNAEDMLGIYLLYLRFDVYHTFGYKLISLVSRQGTSKLIVLQFTLVCCEINELFVDVAVTLYCLQLSRPD
jgi:hypothetical protein